MAELDLAREKERTLENQEQSAYLDGLNDHQKTLLASMAYLDVNEKGIDKIKNGGLTVSELGSYLSDPDSWYIGGLGQETITKIIGKDICTSDKELLAQLEEAGLGDLKIKDIAAASGFISNGFQAMAFQDNNGNAGMSFRGSDLSFSKGAFGDWAIANVAEFFANDSPQMLSAMTFYAKNRDENGNNFLFGHSLGGNLVAHVFAKWSDDIQMAFCINANPINDKLIDSPEKEAAFTDRDKFQFNIIGGDIVGFFKSHGIYSDDVNYVLNNEKGKTNILSSHLVESASYDTNGNFVQIDKEAAIERIGAAANGIMGTLNNLRNELNQMGNSEQAVQIWTNAAWYVNFLTNSGTLKEYDKPTQQVKDASTIKLDSIELPEIDILGKTKQKMQDNSIDLDTLGSIVKNIDLDALARTGLELGKTALLLSHPELAIADNIVHNMAEGQDIALNNEIDR